MKTAEAREETATHAWPDVYVGSYARVTDDTYYGLIEAEALPILPLGTVTAVDFESRMDEIKDLVISYVGALGTDSDAVPGRIVSLPTRQSTDTLVREIKEISGLTWDELGRMFGVSTRAVHHWAQGGRPNSFNDRRIRRIHSIVRATDKGEASATRNALMGLSGGQSSLYVQLVDEVTSGKPVDGFTPLELISVGAENSSK